MGRCRSTHTRLTTPTPLQTVPKVTVGPPPIQTKEGIPPPPPPPPAKGDYPVPAPPAPPAPAPPAPPAKGDYPVPAPAPPAPPQGGWVTGSYQPVQPKPTYVTAGAAGLRVSALVLAGALAGVAAL